KLLSADAEGISKASALLRDGALVAIPTETVYGLAADATSDLAVAAIFDAKGRPTFNPLIVHVASLKEAEKIAEFDADAIRLAEAFWPGPLTLVLPLKPGARISKLVSAGLQTVALRVPAQAEARAVLKALGRPLAAPSANPSGRISPTTAAHVIEGLGGRIAAVLDAGPCSVGLESTILATRPTPVLLRPGGLPRDAIEACLGSPVADRQEGEGITAPGQLTSHYAPKGSLRLNAASARPGEVMLGFGPVAADLNLSPGSDLREAAARLFDCLHMLDAKGAKQIAVSPIPDVGLGLAINDRLRRAAAPRG
ncbi:MAG: threonylcarbamoyl-AMP synthase, partial [Alphaproteobacteria bacterium]|nr:threonylcarbamoyl-AMP synthase [Alphaproteobacteria bacterium]